MNNTAHCLKKIAPALTLLLLALVSTLSGQNLPRLKPQVKESKNFNRENSKFWQSKLEQYAKISSGDLNYESLSEIDKIMIDSLDEGYGPLTQGIGCSWYCAGGPYKITSSESMKEDGKITYLPDNIHDFNLFTAWIPDNSNGSIGKKINFHFKPFSPRVNEIIIWNGYIKNSELWKANSRVAQFKLIIDGKPEAILELEDISNTQSFLIDSIQSTDSTKDFILTLEIIKVYKGSKYDEVAVSEINFNGLDVHCFVAGTKITMADSSLKCIEDIDENDYVQTFNLDSRQLSDSKVTKLIKSTHSNLIRLKFNDREIIVTDDHPFWTQEKQWASINPEKSNNNYNQESDIEQLNNGDRVYLVSENRFIDLIEIEEVRKEQITYTLELSAGDNFIANGLLVKTESAKWEN